MFRCYVRQGLIVDKDHEITFFTQTKWLENKKASITENKTSNKRCYEEPLQTTQQRILKKSNGKSMVNMKNEIYLKR